jgi:hypothetical protein
VISSGTVRWPSNNSRTRPATSGRVPPSTANRASVLAEHLADTLGASEVRHEPQQRPGYRPG